MGYHRKFVPGHGETAKPLIMLTKKDEPEQLCWTPESEQAFLLLRKLLCDAYVLTISSSSDKFRLHTNASGAGIGAVLTVVQDNEFPVAYYSRQLQGAEAETELECLAVVAAVRHFETYLAGREFELVTDHQALQGLRTTKNHNRHLTRWSLFLQDFRFEVVYKPGPQNSNVDGLSRQ